MPFRFKIQNNDFVIADDSNPKDESLRYTRLELRFEKTATDVYFFKKILDNTVKGKAEGYAYADVLDIDGNPFTTQDAFDTFLSKNLGGTGTITFVEWGAITGTLEDQTDLKTALDGKEPGLGNPAEDGYVLSSTALGVRSWVPQNTAGLEAFFLQARGEFGTGGGWADEGFIGDLPVLLFASNVTEKSVYSFFALGRVILDNIDPLVVFLIYSTTSPVVTTGDSVKWQLEVRYIAETESSIKSPDQILVQTQVLTALSTDARQAFLEFTLDKSLIEDQDSILLTLSRIGGDEADNYANDIAVGQSGIVVETFNHNPVT